MYPMKSSDKESQLGVSKIHSIADSYSFVNAIYSKGFSRYIRVHMYVHHGPPLRLHDSEITNIYICTHIYILYIHVLYIYIYFFLLGRSNEDKMKQNL